MARASNPRFEGEMRRQTGLHPSVFLEETAVVEPGATIDQGTRVWNHSQVRQGAVIGRRCNLGKNVFVDGGVRIGDRVKIQNNVSVYSGVQLQDDVFVGPSVVFTNDPYPRSSSPDWHPYETIVRRGASLGANSTLLCGIEIGQWAMVAAGAVVTRSVKPHELVAGNPARRLGWVCRCGQVFSRSSGELSPGTCEHCGSTVPASES